MNINLDFSAKAKWRKRRLRFDAQLNPLKSKLGFPRETEVSFVPMDAVGEYGGLRLHETRQIEDVYQGYTYFADGDVCIAKITPCFENGKGALAEGLTNGVAFGTTELHVIRPLEGLDPKFLFYLTISDDFRSFGEAEMHGAGGQKRIPEDFIKNWTPALPPLETQRRISQFLDEKTARIDALIEKKRALLDRLAEKRQALITHAVTKGLNPDAPMKPSGIDWLGDIPAHWEVRRVKELGLLIGGSGFPHDYQGEKGLPLVFLKVADLGRVVQSEKLVSAENSIAYETAKTLGATIIRPGDVVFAKVGAALLLNRFRCIGVDCCIDNNMMAFRPNTLISTEFALASLSRINFSDIVNPGAVPSVNGGQIGRIQIALPQKSEQNQIVRYLTNRFSGMEFIEKRIHYSIDMLVEYRAALITAAVTGQLEVA